MLGVPSGCFGRRNTAPERRANEAQPHRSPLLFFYPYVRGELVMGVIFDVKQGVTRDDIPS